MNSERWKKVKALFDAVVELEPVERKGFLDKSCGVDEDLRRDVERLLASSDEAESFMETPAIGEVADVIEGNLKKLKSGEYFGHYEILQQIGEGGMGEVYLAKDKKLDRHVAIKVLNEQFSRHESNLQRFILEAKAASGLNHPNILVIHEIGESDNSNYIVSEFIEGKTLREIVDARPTKLTEILDIAIQVVSALSAAHQAKIVHRDIKPENIMLRPDGYVKILDFGLAKLIEQKGIGLEASTVKQNQTGKGVILGTFNYMSPEQAKAEKIDERSDIFSFGVVLYEMIAGRTPFSGASTSETFANLINAEPLPLARYASNVPDELLRIISKMLRKHRDERYQTMKGLLADLRSLQKHLDFEAELWQRKSSEQIAEKETQIQTPKSIAVLPFANLSADAENEYFCDGLAEELLNALAKIEALKVAARTSAFFFKGKNTNVSEIGNVLNVKTVLEGSVRKSGNKLRITVQLINTADGYHLWSERYDREMQDIFDLQDLITLAIVDALKVKLLGEERLARNYTDNVEAYQLYLKGRFHVSKLTPSDMQMGISYFQQALEIDPSYALAHVGLANAFLRIPIAAEMPSTAFFPQAKASAQKAIEIDDRLADAHAALSWITFWYDWDWTAAENQAKRALELNPNSADAHEAYAHLLSNTERHTEALAEIKRARELDPLNLLTNALESQFLLHAGKLDEALAGLQKTFELEPNFWLAHLFAASAYIEKGLFAEAVVEAEKARAFSGGSSCAMAYGAYALSKSGKQAEARAALEELFKLATERYVPPYHTALAYHSLGERDETLDWLERGFEQRDPKMTFLKVEPKWNNLRDDHRFQDLLRRVGLLAD